MAEAVKEQNIQIRSNEDIQKEIKEIVVGINSLDEKETLNALNQFNDSLSHLPMCSCEVCAVKFESIDYIVGVKNP